VKRAFTLVEILISSAILFFLVTGIYRVLNIADKVFNDDMGLLYLGQQARQAMDGMSREVRQGWPSGITIDNAGERITFSTPDTSSIRYYRDAVNNQLVRQQPAGTGSARVLANNVNSLNFSLSGNTLVITFRLQKVVRGRTLCFPAICNPQQFLTEQVTLRN